MFAATGLGLELLCALSRGPELKAELLQVTGRKEQAAEEAGRGGGGGSKYCGSK